MGEPSDRNRRRAGNDLGEDDYHGPHSDSSSHEKMPREEGYASDKRRVRRSAYDDRDGEGLRGDGSRKRRRRSESPRERRERYSADRNEYRRRDAREVTERDHDERKRSEHPHSAREREHASRTSYSDARSHSAQAHRSHHRSDHERDRSPSSSRHRHKKHSEHHNHHHHRRHGGRRRSSVNPRPTLHAPAPAPALVPASLPFDARALSRTHDLEAFRPLLARYLDVQKQKDITMLDEREVRGRWKSFVSKWNTGELAEGWYSPEIFEEARVEWEEVVGELAPRGEERHVRDQDPVRERDRDGEQRYRDNHNNINNHGRGEGSDEDEGDEDDDDDDDYGPILPGQARALTARHGPNVPTLQDLSLRAESQAEEQVSRAAQLRLDRRADRAEQKARLEELAPRAEPGSRERRLEKKREVGEMMRGFRERKSPEGAPEMGDAELLGGGGGGGGGGPEGSLEEYKRARAAAERKKTERELRREEMMRAKAAEREERVRAYREREEGVLEGLREIARLRFG
ncbi:hypothetical protein F5X99DRAFT_427534 [Biscogniauxia marginata]|nr:hypothetical protein F5X99DRAFT_427534 [Biscogniauxia marginata]